MAVPYLANALRGWTTKRTVNVMQKTVVNHQVTYAVTETLTLDINIQPTPKEEINKKPEEQRSWKWWNLLVKEGPLLKNDDIVLIDNVKYKIMSVSDWSESGFQNYSSIKDFE
jgi:hypothetical protein